MLRSLALAAFALASVCCLPALAQVPGGGVGQSGSVTANDCAAWVGNGLIKDAGAACGGGGGSGTVTSVTIATTGGGSNTGTCTSTTVINCTLTVLEKTTIRTTGNYATTDSGTLVDYNSASDQTPTIPTAASAGAGLFFDTCSIQHSQTLTRSSSDTIGGGTTLALGAGTAAAPTCVRLTSDGVSNWAIIFLASAGGSGNALFGTTTGNTSGDVVTMSNTTVGVQDSGTALSALAPKASPIFTGVPAAPTASAGDSTTQIATDAFVTTAVANAVAGINPAVAVQVATVSAGDTSGLTYANGASGIGATFTGPNNTATTIDGVTFTTVGQRLLVKNDTQSPSGAFNGIYSLTALHTGITGDIFTRALDYDQPSDMNNTGSIPVTSGTVNASTSWLLTSSIVTVGTSPLTYVKFSINPLAGVPFNTGSSTGNTVTGPFAYFVCTAACTVTPPVPVAGYQFCVMNDDNVSSIITLGALGSSALYEKTARTGYGTAGTGTLTSGGAVGDMICIVGRDSTHYLSPTYVGTWTAS
jgi:hypothetical protein